MVSDDETTASKLCKLLKSRGYSIDLRTVLRCRSQLGKTFRGSAYCQLIREANKVKHVDWCTANGGNDFSDVIFTDECTVQLESHRRTCCRMKGQPPKNQSHGAYRFSTQNKGIDLSMISFSLRAKHPTKVHVWAGISKKGPTQICIFDGIMKAPLYVNILERTLLPFIARVMPTSHRFMADNDPKHTSRLAQNFLQEKKINWWRTPAESPDLNPIENLWHA